MLLMFFLQKKVKPRCLCNFSLFVVQGCPVQNPNVFAIFTLDGEVLEPILPYFGASFWGPPKVGSKTSPQELPGERSWNLGGSLGDPLGPPGEPLGLPSGPLETPWDPLGPTWAPLGSLWGALGCLLGAFGTFCDHLGSLWQPISCLFVILYAFF